jgi:hypothetical protein
MARGKATDGLIAWRRQAELAEPIEEWRRQQADLPNQRE